MFVETLNSQDGIIKAKVTATSGDKFLYTFKTIGNNYKITTEEGNPNLNDFFKLINKKLIN